MATLDELLELATREPGYGPRFYRTLLESLVYAIRPARGHRVEDGIVRFVLWTGADGAQVIPFFSSHARIEQHLTPWTEACPLSGRMFLDATRGATVVLNPNAPFSCRMSPPEVRALLATGAVSQPEAVPGVADIALRAVDTPPERLLLSLVADSTPCRATIPPHAGPPFHGMPGHPSTHVGPGRVTATTFSVFARSKELRGGTGEVIRAQDQGDSSASL